MASERKPLKNVLSGRRALFISYNGMLDPLGQSQVIPYLRELANLGVIFTLLSFERDGAFTDAGLAHCKRLRSSLADENIEWHWLRYHKRPSLPATVYDVLAGIRYAERLVRKNQIELVHARSHIPGTIALALKRRFGIRFIFDIRGLMAEEYRDAEHWTEGSIPYRLTKKVERRALEAADGIVTLTEKIWPVVREWPGLRGRPVVHEVVPCCVDLKRFQFSEADRERRRAELNLKDRFTIVYSGSIDGWYLTERMAEFFATFQRSRPDAHFLWLTPGKHDRIKGLMEKYSIQPESYSVRFANSDEVPSYLSAADAGIALIKPCFSKLASSPTKNAEYLACGLPLIINAGIGDSDVLINEEHIGALLSNFAVADYTQAATVVETLSLNPAETRKRAREVAERLFNLKTVGITRYARLYQRVLQP